MSVDPMADAPRNEPIEALLDGEWLEVEWSQAAWDGSPYGTEGWASDGMLTLDLEAWRYPGDPEPEPHGCPTHGDDCPGHLHWETWGEGDLVRLPSGDAITRAALNAAMVEAGSIRPQRAMVGVDLAADSPVVVAHEDGTVSWSEFDGHLGVEYAAPSWHDTYQAVRDVAAKHAPDYGTTAVHRHRGGHSFHYRAPCSALWSPPRHDVPELTPPLPATGCASRGAFLYEGESWQVTAWPGYPQDDLLERLNLRWRYGHPPATPDRARRAGVQP